MVAAVMHSLSESISELEARARRVSILLESFATHNPSNPLESTIKYLLNSQDEQGGWVSADYIVWEDVITSFALQALFRVGFHEKSTWEITHKGASETTIGSIEKAFLYFVGSQQPDGRWGQDFFDHCQVLKVLFKHRKASSISMTFDKGMAYLEQVVLEDLASVSNAEWFGPGFYAAALEIFYLVEDQAHVSTLLEALYGLQDNSGVFKTKTLSEGNDLCVWHTSLAILVLLSMGIPSTAVRLQRALNWLETHQNADGSWGTSLARQRVIYTSYGVLALAAAYRSQNDHVARGIDWLVANIERDGSVGGMDGTVMAALAFERVYTLDVTTNIPLTVLFDIQQLIRDQQSLLSENSRYLSETIDAFKSKESDLTRARELTTQALARAESIETRLAKETDKLQTATQELANMQAKWNEHPVRLSNRFLTITGWIVGIIGLVLALITLF